MTLTLIWNLSFIEQVFAAPAFKDTFGHWAEEDIDIAVEKGYINGYSDGYFKPDVSIKRAEFVKLVNQAMGYTATTDISFSDVRTSDWFYKDIQKGVEAGYVNGYSNGSYFLPNNPITREEVAVILYRISPGETNTSLKDVGDQLKINAWALPAVKSAYGKGYLSGYPDGNFYPQQQLTRAQAVKVVNSVLGIDAESMAVRYLDFMELDDKEAYVTTESKRAGTLYWVLLDGDAKEPSPLLVSQGKDIKGESAIAKGNIKVKAYEEATFAVKSLEEDKTYLLCAMVKDSKNKLSGVRSKKFTTSDTATIGEEWLKTFTIESTNASGTTLRAKSSEAGKLYWVAVESKSDEKPSQANIKAGNDKHGEIAAAKGSVDLTRDTEKKIEITGLKSGTSYHLYGFVEKGSEYSTVASRSLKTDGVSTPSISTLGVSAKDETTATISVSSNGPGTVYWIILQESGSASSIPAEKIAAGQRKDGTAATKAGSFESKDGTTTGDVSGLEKGKSYRVYACIKSKNGDTYSGVKYTNTFQTSSYAENLTELKLTYQEIGTSAPVEITKDDGFEFSSTTYAYNTVLTIPYGAEVAVTAAAPSGVLYTDGTPVKSGEAQVIQMPTKRGDIKTFTVEVTDVGKTKRSYTIKVKEATSPLTKVNVYGASVSQSGNTYTIKVPSNYTAIVCSFDFGKGMTAKLVQNQDGSDVEFNGIKSGDEIPRDGIDTGKTLKVTGSAITMTLDIPGADSITYTLKITK